METSAPGTSAPSREQIRAVIIKHIQATIEDVDIEMIDMAHSMAEVGATSLDIVEVVSRTMRELRIKVPRVRLMELKNIEGLVELLYEMGQEKARLSEQQVS